METLSLQASKILQRYISEETEISFIKTEFWITKILTCDITSSMKVEKIFKTLTLEEALELLPISIDLKILNKTIDLDDFIINQEMFKMKENNKWQKYMFCYWNSVNMAWKTLLEAVEKMLLWLHKNNLLSNYNWKCWC